LGAFAAHPGHHRQRFGDQHTVQVLPAATIVDHVDPRTRPFARQDDLDSADDRPDVVAKPRSST
jgi:hypothetical protein